MLLNVVMGETVHCSRAAFECNGSKGMFGQFLSALLNKILTIEIGRSSPNLAKTKETKKRQELDHTMAEKLQEEGRLITELGGRHTIIHHPSGTVANSWRILSITKDPSER